ncbi:hypothetical protein [Paracoccus endophyticus]|nr:hypothetical protein [Paracoccus endophyticus]
MISAVQRVVGPVQVIRTGAIRDAIDGTAVTWRETVSGAVRG